MSDTRKRRKKSQTGLCQHLKVNKKLLKLSWSLIGFMRKIRRNRDLRLIEYVEIVPVKLCANPIKC